MIQSCETCKYAEKTNSMSYPFKCLTSNPVPMMVHEYCVGWFGYVGCASHSDFDPQAEREKADDWIAIGDSCPFCDLLDNCPIVIKIEELREGKGGE